MRWAVVVIALAALAWPGTALAKEVKSAAVCGADGCEDAGGGQQFITLFQDPPSMPGGTNGANVHTVLDPVRVQPYYRVVVTMGGRGERTFHAVFFFVAPNLFRAYDQTGVLSIPFYHPVRLVESMNLLDQMTKGKVLFGVGSGWQGTEPNALERWPRMKSPTSWPGAW